MSAKNMATTMKKEDNNSSAGNYSSVSNGSASNSEDDSASDYESSSNGSANSKSSANSGSHSIKSHSVSNGSNSIESHSVSNGSKSNGSKSNGSKSNNSVSHESNEPATPKEPAHPEWPQQEGDFNPKGWYNHLVIPAARSWVWCQQSHYHALDLYRSSAQGEKAYQVKQTYKDNKSRYGFLRKEVNPRRLNGNHWERFTLHASELQKIGDRYGQAFRRGIETLNALHGAGFSFCEETFAADIEFMGGYVAHEDYLHSLHTNANAENGKTGAERAELVNSRKFLWSSWGKVKEQFKCAMANNKDDEEKLEILRNARKSVKVEFIQKTSHHSVRCLLRMFINRTTFSHVFLPSTGN